MKKNEIIIIEDDVSLNRLLRNNLAKYNINCDFAYNGSDALKLIRENNYTLALIDYRLPDYDGLDLSKRIKQISDKTGFIIITGQGDERIAVEMMKQGALDYIIKDTNLYNILSSSVLKALETIKLKYELESAQRKLIDSEILYRTLVRQIPDIIIIHNDEKIMFINDSITDYFDLKPYELINKNFFSLMTEEIKIKIIENLKNIKKGNASELFEIDIITKNGEKKYFNIQNEKINYYKKEAFLTVLTDITKIKLSEEKIVKAIIDTQEKERARFAEDLHDDLGPILSSLKIYTNLLTGNGINKSLSNEYKTKISNLIDLAISNTRLIANNLMPNLLYDYGLIKALKSFTETINSSKYIKINLKTNLKIRIENSVEITLYRILTELINNTIKHAKASKINISITLNKNILNILYSDNGVGISKESIDNSKTHMGLTNIYNRLKSLNAEYTVINESGFNIIIKKQLL